MRAPVCQWRKKYILLRHTPVFEQKNTSLDKLAFRPRSPVTLIALLFVAFHTSAWMGRWVGDTGGLTNGAMRSANTCKSTHRWLVSLLVVWLVGYQLRLAMRCDYRRAVVVVVVAVTMATWMWSSTKVKSTPLILFCGPHPRPLQLFALAKQSTSKMPVVYRLGPCDSLLELFSLSFQTTWIRQLKWSPQLSYGKEREP